MRKKQPVKRLIIESLILAGLIACLIALSWYLGSIADDYQQQSQQLENEVNDIAAAATTLQDKYTKVTTSPLQPLIAGLNAAGKLSINRQAAKDGFSAFKHRYYLNDVHLNMSSLMDMKEPYKRDTALIVASEVTVTLNALSDEHIYSVIEAMQTELPASVKITRLSLQREDALTPDTLRAISRTGIANLIKGEMKFIWMGIKPIENDSKDDAPSTPKP